MRLHRLSTDPVLVPSAVRWESAAVFNPALAVRGRRLVMLYRASDLPFGRAYDSPYVSAIGYAESSDGINWERRPEPVLRGEREWEARGPEDPRLTRIGGRWHMVYTAFGG
ncbi:MAG: glycosidase, partial [Bacillota bacterium]|nr:glycosidase [Bacillota bacterium]